MHVLTVAFLLLACPQDDKLKTHKAGDMEYGFVYGGKAYSFKAMAQDSKTEKFKAEVEKILKAMEPKGGK